MLRGRLPRAANAVWQHNLEHIAAGSAAIKTAVQPRCTPLLLRLECISAFSIYSSITYKRLLRP